MDERIELRPRPASAMVVASDPRDGGGPATRTMPQPRPRPRPRPPGPDLALVAGGVGVHAAEKEAAAALSPPEALRVHIQREAALAQRADLDYSVIVFTRRAWRVDAAGLRRLVEASLDVMQSGDELGWLDDDRIALSLPLTGAAQAAARAAWIARGSAVGDCAVYSQHRPVLDARANAVPAVPVHPLDVLRCDPLPRWKRVVDVVGAVVALILASPIMLIAAVLVRLSSPGVVILRQRRAGLHGVPFVVYKFRTMVQGAEAMKAALLQFNERSGPVFKMRHDPRVTKIGRVLRATSIDELPQLWNVLRGEMSLVGPRPPTLDEVDHYRAWHCRRLSVKPGITCFWQVSARGGVAFDDWVRMDLRYIERRSLLCDLGLLAATVPAVLSRRGAS